MMNIERRVAAIEAKAAEGNASLNLVLVEMGETTDQAMKRTGFASNAANVICVVFVSPMDASL